MRQRRLSTRLVGAACAAGIMLTGLVPTPVTAAEDYSFSVSYRAYLSGVRVGKGSLSGRFDGTDYRLNATGEISGMARLIARHQGSSEARGSLISGGESFRAQASGDGKHHRIKMRLEGHRVRDVQVEPEPEPHRINHPARIPITAEHKRDIIDPLRALVTVGGYDGDRFDPAVCDHVLPVFSGGERLDVALRYREVRTVSSPRSNGYSGPVLVCDARYRPVAGHRSDHSAVRYLSEDATIEVMLAPTPGSDLLVPFRVTVSTPFGPAVLQAQTFIANGRYAASAAAR